jgi:hypothetical protein
MAHAGRPMEGKLFTEKWDTEALEQTSALCIHVTPMDPVKQSKSAKLPTGRSLWKIGCRCPPGDKCSTEISVKGTNAVEPTVYNHIGAPEFVYLPCNFRMTG